MTGRTVRLGLLGAADIAVRRILPTVSRAPGITLTAVASRDPERARTLAAAYGADALPDYRAVLADPRVDAVYVPVPAALHADWVRAALEAGKHVLAEKPLTTDPRTTAELVALAEKSGLVLRENYLFVHHPQHRAVLDLIARGAVGEVRAVSAAFTIPPRPPADIRYRADLGGGALLDVGVYPLRAAQLLLGPALRVAGAVLRTDPARGVDVGGAAMLCRDADGAIAHLTFGMEHRYTSRYEVLGSTGRLLLDHAFTPPPDHRPVLLLEGPDGVRRHELEPYDQCLGGVEAFARAVGAGEATGDTTGDPTGRTGGGTTGGTTDDPTGDEAGTSGAISTRQAELTADIQRQAQYAVGGDAR
ncbi:oxidoreductase [Streptomyces sp. JV178]|uniref:Gfo/Idh/MocA family protein n=1 Tax=Streptomyces sp. JV178 TaxID=858632 RepID=UPI000C1B4880|nr:Gfo/Idh/MocA family oxidoreductase [Streptomyces sp. JV178]PIM74080.1 oxidoreductase [Streptomyces sp. JV178]